MIEARTVIHRETDARAEFGAQLFQRYGGDAGGGPEFNQAIRAQAAKRVALQFVPERVASWDHRKLGGAY